MPNDHPIICVFGYVFFLDFWCAHQKFSHHSFLPTIIPFLLQFLLRFVVRPPKLKWCFLPHMPDNHPCICFFFLDFWCVYQIFCHDIFLPTIILLFLFVIISSKIVGASHRNISHDFFHQDLCCLFPTSQPWMPFRWQACKGYWETVWVTFVQ